MLTGFLGSGKTTLLKTFIESLEAKDVGVVVNEIGEIDVDGAVLTQSAQKVPLALLSNGCICCAGDGDLAGTIAMLQEERAGRGLAALRRVIVETSGAARPGPVLRGLQLLGSKARSTCIATLDARDWRRAFETREGRAQLAGAQRVVLTKLDCVSDAQKHLALDAARAANPLGEIIVEGSLSDRAQLAFLNAARRSTDRSEPLLERRLDRPDRRIRSSIVRFGEAVAFDELAEWLDNLAGLLGERLFRVKGLVRVEGADHRILVQGVGTTIMQPVLFPAEGAESFLVVIGDGLESSELQSVEPALPCAISHGKRMSTVLGRELHQLV
ncbi:MAG: GTP-binding protein [Propionivibrio sp.]|nr:GTP-binding protein [Propionivibrio sp.]